MPWTNDKYISKFKFKDDKEQNKPFTAERLDEAVTDIAEGISQTLHVGGDNYMKAPLKMNGNKITGLAPGVNVSDAATVGQASGGGVFAVDNSTDPAKIDLTQIPLKTVTEYKDGLQVTFKVRNNSVANMQVQLNELGYISLDKAGIGSFIQGDIKTLQFIDNVFVCINSENTRMRVVDKNTVPDLNDVTEPCQLALVAIGVANVPTSSWGFVTVKGTGTNSYVEQTYGTHDNNTYKRVKIDQQPWQPWRKMVTEDEHQILLGKLGALVNVANYGTKNGNFKFLPRKGSITPLDLANVDYYGQYCKGKGRYKGRENWYFSLLLDGSIEPTSSFKNGPSGALGGMWMFIVRPYTDMPASYIVYNSSDGPTFIWRPKGASIWTHSPYQLWQDWEPV